jgi:hypothetical protein
MVQRILVVFRTTMEVMADSGITTVLVLVYFLVNTFSFLIQPFSTGLCKVFRNRIMFKHIGPDE